MYYMHMFTQGIENTQVDDKSASNFVTFNDIQVSIYSSWTTKEWID